jgi:hypothetical protein
MTGCNQPGRCRTGPHHARMPQPFIDALAIQGAAAT